MRTRAKSNNLLNFFMSVFGDNLKAARLAKKMTLMQCSDALGITNPALSQWEQGKREPKFSMLIEICLLLNTSPNELLGFNASAVSAPPREIVTGDNSPVAIGGSITQTINNPPRKRKAK